jgi:hypothetical protein
VCRGRAKGWGLGIRGLVLELGLVLGVVVLGLVVFGVGLRPWGFGLYRTPPPFYFYFFYFLFHFILFFLFFILFYFIFILFFIFYLR